MPGERGGVVDARLQDRAVLHGLHDADHLQRLALAQKDHVEFVARLQMVGPEEGRGSEGLTITEFVDDAAVDGQQPIENLAPAGNADHGCLDGVWEAFDLGSGLEGHGTLQALHSWLGLQDSNQILGHSLHGQTKISQGVVAIKMVAGIAQIEVDTKRTEHKRDAQNSHKRERSQAAFAMP